MGSLTIDDAIGCIEHDYSVLIATNPCLIQECYRVRYQVYCTERGFEIAHGGAESDAFDSRAVHVALLRADGEVVGTTRLLRWNADPADPGIPMQMVCRDDVFAGLPLSDSAEISRFAISRERRTRRSEADGLLRLMLVKGILRASRAYGLSHWCAVMEPTLLRLLRAASVHFEPRGPLVDCYGQRQPVVGEIDSMLARGLLENRTIWNYVTDGGQLAASTGPEAIAA